MVSKGQFVGLDWNRIARLHSEVMTSTCKNSLTASCCHIRAFFRCNQPTSSQDPQIDPCSPQSPVAQWLEYPNRSRRVVGSNPIWDADFFPSLHFTSQLIVVCCFIFNKVMINHIKIDGNCYILFVTFFVCI